MDICTPDVLINLDHGCSACVVLPCDLRHTAPFPGLKLIPTATITGQNTFVLLGISFTIHRLEMFTTPWMCASDEALPRFRQPAFLPYPQSYELGFQILPSLNFIFALLLHHSPLVEHRTRRKSNMDRMAVPRSQLDAPYAERWELLKPVMSQLYIDEKKKLKDIVKIMAAEYKFFASSVLIPIRSLLYILQTPNANSFVHHSENQYKRQFGLWNVSKVLTSKKKEKITKVLQTRSRQGKDTTVTYNGQDGNKKMRRYLKTRMRSDVSLQPSISLGIENLFGHALQCGNRL